MRYAAFSRIAACIVGISCSFTPMTSWAQSCKCPKNPGPGGGVQCAKDQIATCDPSSGECNCTCDSVQAGKSKADYEAQIFSRVLHAKVDPAELSSPRYQKFVSSFHKTTGDNGTFSFDKEAGTGRGRQVKVGVPEWLEGVLGGKGGVSIGPGAFLQNCPNGTCTGRDNNDTTINATTNAPNSAAVGINSGTINVGPVPKIITPQDMVAFTQYLLTAKSKARIRVDALQGSNSRPFADDFYNLFKNGKWDMGGAGVYEYIGLSLPEHKFKGAVVITKGQPSPNETVPVTDDDPLFYIGKVLEGLKVPCVLKRDPNMVEGLINIQFEGIPD